MGSSSVDYENQFPLKPEAGLEARYDVKKINDPEGKHEECRYFVLDPQHDLGARFALRAYKVWAKQNGHVALATDLGTWLDSVEGRA